MGTKGGKPITAIEKRQLRMMKEEARKKAEEKKEKRQALGLIDPSLVDKIAKDVKNMDVVTPFVLVQKYNIKYSTAKKIILELVNRGVLELYSKTRRLIIALPKKS